MSNKYLSRAIAAITLSLGLSSTGANAAELVFWSMWNEPEPQAAALRKIMDNYTKAHPETTFKVVWNGRQNQTKLRAALQAGTQVDFADQDGDQLAGGLQKEGLAYEIAADLGDTKAALLPGVLELYASHGKMEQVPYIYNTVNIWYNKEMLAETGSAVPQTLDELFTLCGKLNESGKSALVTEGNVANYQLLYFSHLLSRAMGSGAVIRAFEVKDGSGWSDPAVLEAAKTARKFWDARCIAEDARGFQYPAGQQTIALGDSMGELVGSWLPTELKDTAGADFPWGAFNFPAVAGGTGKITDIEVGLLSVMVLKSSQNAREAASFVRYLLSEEAQEVLVADGGVGVVRDGVEWPQALADAQASAKNATSLSGIGGGLGAFYPEFNATVLSPEFSKMFLGQSTPEDFVKVLVDKTKDFWGSQQ